MNEAVNIAKKLVINKTSWVLLRIQTLHVRVLFKARNSFINFNLRNSNLERLHIIMYELLLYESGGDDQYYSCG